MFLIQGTGTLKSETSIFFWATENLILFT